jgi:hypothetical protein
MDFTFLPATTTTMTPSAEKKLPPAAGPAPSSACRQLPWRFVPAASPPSPAPAAEPRSRATGVIMAEDHQEPRQPPEKTAGPDTAAAKAAAEEEVEDRMDQLWEDFNEELGQLARARRLRARGGGSCRRDRHRDDDGLLVPEGGRRLTRSEPSPPSSSSSDDAESEHAARAAGCAPVLRPSARHCRRRAGTWVLLMRIFRRLFVIEKTISAAAVARQRSSSSARAR